MASPMPEWLAEWLSPAVVFGGIVWGVQLNYQVLALTKRQGAMESDNEKSENKVKELSEQLFRTSVILERLETRLAKLESES